MHAPLWSAAAFGVCVAVTVAMWGVAHRAGRHEIAKETRVLGGQVGERLRACVQTRVEMIAQIRREWDLGGIHDDVGFASRIEALLATFPGYQAVNRIEDGVISFVFPLEPNRRALGRKIADTPSAYAEYQRALVDGTPRMTPPLELFQAGTGFATYVPTTAVGASRMVLNGVFRTDALITACLGADDIPTYSLSLHDGAVPVFVRERPPEAVEFAVATTLPLFNRSWILRIAPGQDRVAAALEPIGMVLVTGLPLSAAVGLLVFALVLLRNRARMRERLAEEQRQAERQRVEEKLQQVQRMEALGQLAAAVAHDFNNLLTIILASSFLITERSEVAEVKDAAKDIDDAARRGSALSRELVTFAKGDQSPAGTLDLGGRVAGMTSLLTRLAGSRVKLVVTTPATPAYIHGSVVHIEQIVVNLVVNATAAMPDGGTLTLDVAARGDTVTLVVGDTGVGIAPEVVPRIFEPFFSTKAPGDGAGLGLATVFGHVQRMKGDIKVESTPGTGTRFVLTFPAVAA